MTNRTRRHSFNQVAGLYDSARPGYPEALFGDILAYADLPPDARILEVGSGTGQATLPLARRGYAMDCLEPGADLAAIARHKLAAYPAVTVICADFETCTLPAARYHLLVSATAFHWLQPEIRFRKSQELLKPRGTLALFWHRPVQTDASRQINDALQQIYKSVAPELARERQAPPHPDAVTTEYEDLIPGSGRFTDLAIHKHYVATAYSASAYVNLMRTWSDHLALEAPKATQLFHDIKKLIQTDFAGEILRETVALLYLARRK